ncbi:acyltransferase [Dermacoccus nishinomiyaensis]|uniref:acyltransferase n=1 Tax=Dermacoccus nishinomiyaensis TaxID=1274 RepID=UPI0011A984E0|nr:acyltransferase [Dermacoccus nishinomiyaensis]
MTDKDLNSFLTRLRVARLLAASTNDIPVWRTVRRKGLERLLEAPGLRMSSNVRLDRSHPELGGRLVLGRDVEIGPRCILDISGGITIEDGVTVSEDSLLLSHDHNFQDADTHWRDQGKVARPLVIGRGAWIGARSTVLGATQTIGEGAVVGACSLVTKPIERMALAMGAPARVRRHRTSAREQQ